MESNTIFSIEIPYSQFIF